jgi:hypothetical protein
MAYEAPEAVEIKMDAEIGSYQEDFDFDFFPEPLTHAARVAEPSGESGPER